MLTSIRRLAIALTLASLALPTASAAASQEQTIVMTAPFAEDAESISCTATGACVAEASADRATGSMTTSASASAVAVPGVSGSDASASATVTGRHEVPSSVSAVRYRVILGVDPSFVAAPPEGAQVRVAARASHSDGVALAGAMTGFAPFTGGIIYHDGDQTTNVTMEVRPAEGDVFPEGTLDVAVSLKSLVLPRAAGDAAVLTGAAQSGFTVERIEATLILG